MCDEGGEKGQTPSMMPGKEAAEEEVCVVVVKVSGTHFVKKKKNAVKRDKN